ncbi:hypothetical protein ERJ75_000617700 [Trypanosoma vivax]|nr:hypothetical protein ERJ75_000617700 [Trypanosoma vivax]
MARSADKRRAHVVAGGRGGGHGGGEQHRVARATRAATTVLERAVKAALLSSSVRRRAHTAAMRRHDTLRLFGSFVSKATTPQYGISTRAATAQATKTAGTGYKESAAPTNQSKLTVRQQTHWLTQGNQR